MELEDIYRGCGSSSDILCKFITGQVKCEELEYWYDGLTYTLIIEHSQDDIEKIMSLLESDDSECRILGERLLFSNHIKVYDWLCENNSNLIMRVIVLIPYIYARLYNKPFEWYYNKITGGYLPNYRWSHE